MDVLKIEMIGLGSVEFWFIWWSGTECPQNLPWYCNDPDAALGYYMSSAWEQVPLDSLHLPYQSSHQRLTGVDCWKPLPFGTWQHLITTKFYYFCPFIFAGVQQIGVGPCTNFYVLCLRAGSSRFLTFALPELQRLTGVDCWKPLHFGTWQHLITTKS